MSGFIYGNDESMVENVDGLGREGVGRRCESSFKSLANRKALAGVGRYRGFTWLIVHCLQPEG